ncbi:acyl-CoA dehydrogenase family protein [Brevundimonas guildfordensis]|uniref:Acyl-CoA dehydrogenase family protein n=1 Tax=Brevundimonas guildfordensis TaxID=2762241 RepID=A0ABR8QWK9_9CAUL|nr:acyl-CoA dehydrogenase family protein [Brevundimonas guildfordensis]MBD7939807.1 acyl-CoA dehydrogenase family protein [Brevundimonas guildfordensis]
MDLNWSPADLTFRDEVRAFLHDNLTEEIRAAGRLMTSVYAQHDASMKWQAILHQKGWVAPAWPIEYGGCGWSVLQRYIFTRERVAAGAPPISPMGVQMCGPALIGYGSDAQKAYFLPRMLNGEHFWCQGYSEPEAGSDLASLQMEAGIDGDDLVCTGTKIWTTHADQANWIFCLVRTSKEDRPQKGITFVLIDMTTPGISVRPIVAPSGEHIQNQVFFDQVRVPKANVVGQIGQGWTVAKYLLEFERGGVAYAPELQERLDSVEAYARSSLCGDRPLADTPGFARKLAEARARLAVLEVFEFRVMSGAADAALTAAGPSAMKVLGTELSQHITELALEAADGWGRAYQPDAGRPGGAALLPHAAGVAGPLLPALAGVHYLNDRAGSIYAGSNEIQRNIIAKAALGL